RHRRANRGMKATARTPAPRTRLRRMVLPRKGDLQPNDVYSTCFPVYDWRVEPASNLAGERSMQRSRRRRSAGQPANQGPADAGVAANVIHGERRNIPALFCDLAGSDALAERLDAEEFQEVVHAFARCCTAVLDGFGDLTYKSHGDSFLVCFGYQQSK